MKDDKVDLLRDLTSALGFLHSLTAKFLPDKKGRKWFEQVAEEMQGEAEGEAVEARNSKSKKAEKEGSGEAPM